MQFRNKIEKLDKLNQAIIDLEHNISYTQREIEILQNIKEKDNKEYNELSDDYNQIDLKIDEIIEN